MIKAKIISMLLLITGVINFAPVAGVLTPGMLEKLYGISGLSNDLFILMHHRALLFGIVGVQQFLQSQWFSGPPEGVVLREVLLRPEPNNELPVSLRLDAGDTVYHSKNVQS